MSLEEKLAPLIGRMAFGWFFLTQVAMYGGDWSHTIDRLEGYGIPAAPFTLAVALLFLTMGAVMLILGYHARYGALFLFVITAIATVLLHAYWRIDRYASPSLYDIKFQLFACHTAIAGGLLMLIGLGPGPLSFDNRGKGGGGKK